MKKTMALVLGIMVLTMGFGFILTDMNVPSEESVSSAWPDMCNYNQGGPGNDWLCKWQKFDEAFA